MLVKHNLPMNDTNLSERKRRITYTTTTEGIERAEQALKKLGFGSKSNFAKAILVSRTTVTKFFAGKPIQFDSFQRICQELQLSDWEAIAGIKKEERLKQLEIDDCSMPHLNEEMEQVETLYRKLIVRNEQSTIIKLELVLRGNISSTLNLKIIESILRRHSGDTIQIIDIKGGSIRLTVKGSLEDVQQLISRIRSGELKEVNGFKIEDIQILSLYNDRETPELFDKWRLVEEIVNHPVVGRSLGSVDLSDADLSDADLSGAELIGAELIGADLSGVNLSDAKLGFAKLSDADLSDADLSGVELVSADLRGADLSGVNLSDAKLIGVKLSGADLIGADLRGADLSGVNLSDAKLNGAKLNSAKLNSAKLNGAKLSGAKLSGAKLSGAKLSDADLRGADLIGADLIGVDLIGADLSGADLSGAKQSGAKAENARFGGNIGISESMKRNLIQRGAIFDDFLGDRSEVISL